MNEFKFEDVFDTRVDEPIGFLPYWSDARVLYCDKAIRTHDKLTDQNKMLRDALQLVSDIIPICQNANGGGYMLILSDDDCRIIKESLNISDL